jgi:alkyl hydroperoxide reductase subunit D
MSELLETKAALEQDLLLTAISNDTLDALMAAESKYLRDARMNLSAFQRSKELNKKEQALVALAISNNNHNALLQKAFTARAQAEGATAAEIADTLACASIMSANNILYRFRHFMSKDTYDRMPAGMRMQVMLNPSVGKEFFELLSLAISAVNGCEMCVRAHESSLLKLGTSEARIFEAVKLAAVATSLGTLVY